MAIIVNGAECRTLSQPIYVNGKRVLEGYCDGVKCYPDKYPFKYGLTRKETKKLPAASAITTVAFASTHYFDGEETDVTYEYSIEEITESDLGLRLRAADDAGDYIYLRPNVMNGESTDVWHLRTTVKVSSKYLGGMTVRGTSRVTYGGVYQGGGWPDTAQYFVEDLQSALNVERTFVFYQSYTLRDTTESDPYHFSPYKRPDGDDGPHTMGYGSYNDGHGAAIHVSAKFGMKTDPDLPDGREEYGGQEILVHGNTDRSLHYAMNIAYRMNTFYKGRAYKHQKHHSAFGFTRLNSLIPTV